MKTWKIEYEIPPLRAIYFAEMDTDDMFTEAEVTEFVREREPLWHIRRMSLLVGERPKTNSW
jgi:hypothetical protein